MPDGIRYGDLDLPRFRVIGIAGTPGTGKKTIGVIVAKLLDYKFLDINAVAIHGRATVGKDEHGFIADTSKIRTLLLREIAQTNTVVAGHLLSEILRKNEIDLIIVLRCSPNELEKRYSSRKYSPQKNLDNLSSELLDISLDEAINTFGTRLIAEIDTTRTNADEVARKILKIYRGEEKKMLGAVKWLSQISGPGDITKYLQ